PPEPGGTTTFATIWFVRGSIASTVPARPLSTHTAPSPVAMSVGGALAGTRLATVPESVFATQTDPSAHVSAPGAAPAVEIEASSVALVGSTLPTASGATE